MRKDARLGAYRFTDQGSDMLTHDQMTTLARASTRYAEFGDHVSAQPFDPQVRALALESLGTPDEQTIIGSALEALGAPDRNIRVAALRVLWWHRGNHEVNEAILRATRDPVRRVRRIAVGICPAEHPGAAQRLREIVDDPAEYHGIRSDAVGRLASSQLPSSALGEVRDLLGSEVLRRRILFMLVTRPVHDTARELLNDIVRVGTKDEAVVATRALCGLRVVNLGSQAPPEGSEPADVGWLISRGMLRATKHAVYHWVRT